MADVAVENVRRQFGDVVAVKDVSLSIPDGQFFTLLGSSGCGKSTMLSLLAGLEEIDQGVIRVGTKTFADYARGIHLQPEDRDCGLVFQSYALWPHMTVRENLAFGLKLRRVSKTEQRKRIDEMLDLVELGTYGDRYIHQLSGGQQQRVALARTLVYRPSLMLLDEPLSNLDAKLRERARYWLRELQQKVGVTTIYVTHDQTEALAMSDQIALLRDGEVVQVADPVTLYEDPRDAFVAAFIGETNFLQARVVGSDRGQTEVLLLDSDGLDMDRVMLSRSWNGSKEVTIAVRPDRMTIAPRGSGRGSPSRNVVSGRITGRTYSGGHYLYDVRVAGSKVRVRSTSAEIPETVDVIFDHSSGSIFEA